MHDCFQPGSYLVTIDTGAMGIITARRCFRHAADMAKVAEEEGYKATFTKV